MSEENTAGARPQDPLVEKYRPDPAQPAAPVRILQGLWGHSDRPGHRRLYFTSSLDTFAEFRVDDVIATEDIPPEMPPFLDELATRVILSRDAIVDIAHSRRAGSINPFDIDIRFGSRTPSADLPSGSKFEPCLLGATPGDVLCDPPTQTCETCFGLFTCGDGASCEHSCFDCPPPDPVSENQLC